MNRLAFARWRSEVPSGGNRYDHELVAALVALGVEVSEHAVKGAWPFPSVQDRARLRDMFVPGRANPTSVCSAPAPAGSVGTAQHWLIGNIVGAAVPDIIREATAAGHRVSMIMHYFAADDETLSPAARARIANSEAEAVAAANTIIATSAWMADEVLQRYGRTDAVVALPGVVPAETAPGSSLHGHPPSLLWLGSITTMKDPLTLVEALSQLHGYAWNARLVGPDSLDPALGREVHERIADAGLDGRVQVLGAREGDALERVWADTDLLVHTSRSEAYGMVITEALAHGIPSIVAEGTGAVEAQQGAGGSFPVGNSQALAAELRTWLGDPHVRTSWRTAAAARRETLPGWAGTARAIAQALHLEPGLSPRT